MKFVKFGALALTLGLFFASCGGGETTTEETTVVEETVVAPEVEEPIAPETIDTTVAPAETAAPEATPAQ